MGRSVPFTCCVLAISLTITLAAQSNDYNCEYASSSFVRNEDAFVCLVVGSQVARIQTKVDSFSLFQVPNSIDTSSSISSLSIAARVAGTESPVVEYTNTYGFIAPYKTVIVQMDMGTVQNITYDSSDCGACSITTDSACSVVDFACHKRCVTNVCGYNSTECCAPSMSQSDCEQAGKVNCDVKVREFCIESYCH
uniref:Uncharacterized protein n=1 Tax=Palpitomonas bilix TaxID=652834 RepID=A0A7S3CYS5_9EUKA|mmetsp:Transcript_15075/g.38107  ORF Transcript_15075/g.38107 Transcript_15075/m.38107 type:complete len:195 (+) Transcript_15075:103-687(+)